MTISPLPLGIIPARANSSRFPQKIIAKINGKPMIQYVWEAASRAKRLGGLIVATDSEEIAAVVRGFGGNAEMTSPDFPSGSDRVAFVAKGRPARIIVNLQGDEPMLEPESIDRLVEELETHPEAQMATLAVEKSSAEDLASPHVVKVVCTLGGEALYFSRAPLQSKPGGIFYKHIGIYAYRRETLLSLCQLPPSELEKVERLEQLRALENGIRIRVALVDCDTVAVDTPEDIARVEEALRSLKR